jgi:hypothetical protein
MKARPLALLVVVVAAAFGLWSQLRIPEPTILSLRVGQTFEEVVAASSFPVLKESNLPADDPTGFGSTWVTRPAVIIKFDDPQHGFVLPPTKFAGVSYDANRVLSIETSPMLEKVPFEQAVDIMAKLQEQFKAGGWQPWPGDGSEWFDFSPEGRKRLYRTVLGPGWGKDITLVVPGKYSLMFRIKCLDGCEEHAEPYLFLIDLSIGSDIYSGSEEAPPR